MIALVSTPSGRTVTGGYRYNANIVRELKRYTQVSYRTVPADENLSGSPAELIPPRCSCVIFDSIFFLHPEYLKNLLFSFPAGRKVLLIHWLPWVEKPVVAESLKDSGLSDLDVPGINENTASLLDEFDAFITTSCYTAGELVRLGIPEKQICTAIPGIEESLLRLRRHPAEAPGPAGRALGCITVSHWTPVKGLHRLIPILENLFKKQREDRQTEIPTGPEKPAGGHWTWHSIGSMNRETAYGEYLLRLIGSGSVSFPYVLYGPMQIESCWELTVSCDICLIPSLFETYGMAAAEAVALGVPVVAFDTGGISEAVRNGRDGFLCSNEEEFACRLQELSQNPCLLAGMKQTCYKKPVVSWKETAEKIYHFLLSL